MGWAAEGIAFDDVRARPQRQALRHQLHVRFDHWLDALESRLPESAPTLAQVGAAIWSLRQQLTAGVAQTLIERRHQNAPHRQHLRCPQCARCLTARPAVPRTVETLVGEVAWHRPYCYGRACHVERSPLDDVWGLRAARMQRDGQRAAAEVARE